MVAGNARDADAARSRQSLKPGRDVDAVAVNIVGVRDHVADIDPDAKAQAALLGHIQIAVGHRALNFGRTTHRVDDAGEFRQHAVTGGLDDPTAMLADLRIDHLAQMRLEAFVRSFLIDAHQARIAHHIGGEDRGKTARGDRSGHFSGGDPFPGANLTYFEHLRANFMRSPCMARARRTGTVGHSSGTPALRRPAR
jgi:hypothetical protein